MSLEQVGNKIKAARRENKISLFELSQLCNLDYNLLRRIESGIEDTKILTLINIADKLEVDVKDLI
jgi:transcriptional regulator with XRE-family HTH domain